MVSPMNVKSTLEVGSAFPSHLVVFKINKHATLQLLHHRIHHPLSLILTPMITLLHPNSPPLLASKTTRNLDSISNSPISRFAIKVADTCLTKESSLDQLLWRLNSLIRHLQTTLVNNRWQIPQSVRPHTQHK